MTIAEIKELAANVRDGFAPADAPKQLARAVLALFETEDPEEALAKAESRIVELEDALAITTNSRESNRAARLQAETFVEALKQELEHRSHVDNEQIDALLTAWVKYPHEGSDPFGDLDREQLWMLCHDFAQFIHKQQRIAAALPKFHQTAESIPPGGITVFDTRPCRECGRGEAATAHDPMHGHSYDPVSK